MNQNTSAGGFSAGVWTFVVTEMIYNTAANQDTWVTYLNGVQVATGTHADAAAASGFPNETSPNGYTFGVAANNNASGFSGYMDDLQVYNSALTSGQVASLFDSYITAVPEPGTWGIFGIGIAGLMLAVRRFR